jgi:hypothetical protein
MFNDDGGVRSVSSSARTRRDRLSRAGAGNRDAVDFGAVSRAGGFRAGLFVALFAALFAGCFATRLGARRGVFLEELARLAAARLGPFVLFLARRLSFFRTRFAMAKIPFKSLTGFG